MFSRITPRSFLVAGLLLGLATHTRGEQVAVSNVGVVTASFSEQAAESVAAAPIDISKSSIEKEQAAIQSAGLSETQKPECEQRLSKALSWVQTAEETANRRLVFESQTKAIPDAVKRIRAALAIQPSPVAVELPEDATVAQLESRLTELKQKTETLEADFAAKKKEAEARTTRMQELAKELAEAEKRVTATQSQITATAPAEFENRSKWFEQAAQRNAILQQIERFRAERRYLEAAAELLPLQRDLAERDLKSQQKLLAAWTTAVESWRKNESLRHAEAARRIAENSHPALRSLAEQNAAIAEERILTASGIEKTGRTVKKLKEMSKTLDGEFETLRQKVAYAGATSSTGVLLRKKRHELPKRDEFSERDAMVKREMPRAHLQLMEWKNLHQEVSDPAEAAEQLLGQLDALLTKYGREQVLAVVTALVNDRRDLLDKAIPDQETYLQELNELDLANQALHTNVSGFREYLDQRVLWMRSDDTLKIQDLRLAAGGAASLVNPSRWLEVARVGGVDAMRTPAVALAVVALFVLLIVFRARLLTLQRQLSEPPLDGEPASFLQYASAFAITFLIAVRWPALFLAIGYRMKMAAGSTLWTQSVGDACLTAVTLAWACEFLREVSRPNGIGESLFRWPKAATRSIGTTLKLTLFVGTPLVAILKLSQFGDLDDLGSLHRVLFIATLSLFVVQIGVVLRPNGRLMRSIAQQSPTATVYRMRHLVWLSTTSAPAGFAVMSISGFHYSACQLSGRLAETGATIVVIIFVYALALCWLEVTGYNRSLQELGQVENQGDLKEGTNTAELENHLAQTNVSIESAPLEELSLRDSAGHEFRQLLRYAAIATMICGGWFIWADVLPALHILDGVELWQNIESVAQKVTSDQGVESIRMTDHPVPTTLTDVLVAILVCAGTIMIGRRLPGVLELTVLDRLPFDQGGRQAIAILVRYAATLAGLLFACHIIRLSWGSVQWLAAAMTVGLGFGLQEIFANLVSGIIILFERPIRMGDLVTVGDVTGNVTRMQMRATTITDFDRRELIVPNKKFITDNVINWTLSDPISRVVLPVGVAYGTNVKQVESILMRIAMECSFVMREPCPTTLFTGFGESTLNIELRVFIPVRDVYVDVVNQLNSAINREFQKAGIQIAFPQRDLHIKSIETLKVAVPQERRKGVA